MKTVVRRDFMMPFGKYMGCTLEQIADDDPGYIIWLADENVLRIDRRFLGAVRRDDMESEEAQAYQSAMEGWPYD